MASEGEEESRAIAVASVAKRLFGTNVSPDAIIDESLERATDPAYNVEGVRASLGPAIDEDVPEILDDESLRRHPLAIWIELEIGLEDAKGLNRRRPIAIRNAADLLAEQTGRDPERCRFQLQAMLILMSRPESERGGSPTRLGHLIEKPSSAPRLPMPPATSSRPLTDGGNSMRAHAHSCLKPIESRKCRG